MSTTCVSSVEAYTKALLHCYKHPTQPVMGLLIGKRLGDEGCFVSDAIPLFHATQMNYPHPMVEVALAHAKSAATTQGLSLVGLYLANERLDDKSINSHAASVIARVRKDVQPALVWFIHNDTLTSPPSRLSVTAFVSKNEAEVAKVEEPSAAALSFGTWNKDTVRLDALPAESGITAVGEALEALTQYGLVDFDDHLEHPELNYLVQPLPEIKERNQPRK